MTKLSKNDHIKAAIMMGQILGFVVLILAVLAAIAWVIAVHPMVFEVSLLTLVVGGGLVGLYRACLADVRQEHDTYLD
jgi:cadmium resistance protein CadD (predicted permease)